MATLAAKRALLRDLLHTLSYRRQPVVLSSGKASDFYIDCKQTTLHPEGAALAGELLWDLVADWTPQAIAGPTLGADPLVMSIMFASRARGQAVPAMIIRKTPKSHGTSAWIEGCDNASRGARVAVVEDVVTSGGSALKAIERARECGYTVVGMVALVDRGEGASEAFQRAGVPFRSLFTVGDFCATD